MNMYDEVIRHFNALGESEQVVYISFYVALLSFGVSLLGRRIVLSEKFSDIEEYPDLIMSGLFAGLILAFLMGSFIATGALSAVTIMRMSYLPMYMLLPQVLALPLLTYFAARAVKLYVSRRRRRQLA